MNTTEQEFNLYHEAIEKQLKSYIFPKEPVLLYDPLRYFFTLGGKRTRPMLAMLACELFGTPGLKAIHAALAIEMFHNFSLLHDDIMDKAPLRRGKTTVHQKWNENIAILSGDVLFNEAYKQLLNYPPNQAHDLIRIFTKVAQEVCEGQQLDMDFEQRNDVTIEHYIEMIRLKTSVLLGAALQMGAVVANISNEDSLQQIYQFGINIGLAFQIQDDVLDLYGNSAKVGKQIGGDIITNKKTYLYLKAYSLANLTEKKALDKAFKINDTKEKVQAVQSIFDALSIQEEATNLKEYYYQKALKEMEKINVDPEKKVKLLYLAKTLMKREY